MKFETLGNAMILVSENDTPVLVTDPWLTGTCYFGSWELERPLSEAQLSRVAACKFVWFSHGHPDHLHPESLDLLDRKSHHILLPDHYRPDIRDFLKTKFDNVEVLPYGQWRTLTPTTRVMCFDNENQDAILLIAVGNSLIINQNDSPLCGDGRAIRKIAAGFDRKRCYLLALSAIDADMFNFVDAEGRRIDTHPADRKPGQIRRVARTADWLGADSYCVSSSQHVYVRADSAWANSYRVTWDDIRTLWTRPHIRPVPPHVVMNLADGTYQITNTSLSEAEASTRIQPPGEDWNEQLEEGDSGAIDTFFRRIETIGKTVDFVQFVVGGKTHTTWVNPSASSRPFHHLKGLRFFVPRKSLMDAINSGFFDDLLIGNFMKTYCQNIELYPHFTPRVAKFAGNAGVYTTADLLRFRWRYLRRNPLGFVGYHLESWWLGRCMPVMRRLAEAIGLRDLLKSVYNRVFMDERV